MDRRDALRDYVVFDLETTGLSCANDHIIELAGVKVLEGEVADEFSTLVNPGCHIPRGASQVNGITDDMVSTAPTICEALPRFLSFVGELPLVGHNIISFDMNFILRACEELPDGHAIHNATVDTLPMARRCLPGMRHHRLTDLAEHFGLSTEGAHRALADCRMNQRIYVLLSDMADNAGPQMITYAI